MDQPHIQTAAEELDGWDRVASMPDCLTDGRFSRNDILAMLWRIRRAEAALNQISETRIIGQPDEISAAQIKAIIDIAKAGLPSAKTEVAAAFGPDYDGPIERGMRFIWEPLKPHARKLIEVTRIIEKPGDDNRIYTKIAGAPDDALDEVWNEESHFREACIPVKGSINE